MNFITASNVLRIVRLRGVVSWPSLYLYGGNPSTLVSLHRLLHYTPLSQNNEANSYGYSGCKSIPEECGTFKDRHSIFYFFLYGLELLIGCWCWWRSVIPLGYYGRRGLIAMVLFVIGYVLSVHALAHLFGLI